MCLCVKQRRAALFEQNVKHFVEYFSETERLVTVDVTCGVADFIWHKVNQVVCDLDFHPCRTVNTVVLFSFGKYCEETHVKQETVYPAVSSQPRLPHSGDCHRWQRHRNHGNK